jgi:hypothetical protein
MKKVSLAVVFAAVATVALAQFVTRGTYSVHSGSAVMRIGGQDIAHAGGSVPAHVPHATRCEELRTKFGAAIVNCWDFEKTEDALLQAKGMRGSAYRPGVTIDRSMAASGKSSIRFETISFNEAQRRCPTCTDAKNLQTARQSNTSWWGRNFVDDLSMQFGLGQEFWIQMRIRENDAFYAGSFGGDGPKKWIIGTGDRNIDHVFTIRDPLPATAGAGTIITLVGTDKPAFVANAGPIKIGDEMLSYHQLDRTANTIKVNHRATPKAHAAGTVVRYAARPSYAGGCTDLELPISQGWNYVPSSYHSCGTKDRVYEGHSLPLISASGFTYDWVVQSGRRGTWNDQTKRWEGGCLLSKVKKGDYSGCVVDRAGEGWNTWTIQVKLGQSKWYTNDKKYEHASTIEVWKNDVKVTDLNPENRHPRPDAMTPEQCRAAKRSVANGDQCLTGYDLSRLPAVYGNIALSGPRSAQDEAQGGGKYGKVWINLQSWRRQYLDQNDPIFCCHPTIVRWYDDLVISTQPIPLPDGRALQ